MPKYLFIALLLPLALAAALPTPPTGRYCTPMAFRDQQIGIGYQAVVRTAAGCTKPALIRKQSRVSGVIDAPVLVPVGQVISVWLFTHRLFYTLDNKTWRPVEVR